MDKFNEFTKWLERNDPQVQYSSLWEVMKRSFEGEDEVHRGYGINNEKDFVKLERTLILVTKVHHRLTKFQGRVVNYLSGLISLVLTGHRRKYRRYGFHYGVNVRDAVFEKVPEFKSFYEGYCEKFGEFYSYSGMRILYYYFIASKLIINEKPRILEIGAGLGNFSIITSRHYNEFEYVILDIPEIIPAAYSNVRKLVASDTELYLPNEYEEFKRSKSKRKILWIVPAQLEMFENDYFDFFCNTESFAEMDPAVSEAYWSKVACLLKDGSHAFLVNRAIRFTGPDVDYSSMSSPFKLKNSDLKVDNIIVDEFRAVIPQLHEKPNLVLTYTVDKSES